MSEPDTPAEVRAFRRAAQALVVGVADHLAALPSRPVWGSRFQTFCARDCSICPCRSAEPRSTT